MREELWEYKSGRWKKGRTGFGNPLWTIACYLLQILSLSNFLLYCGKYANWSGKKCSEVHATTKWVVNFEPLSVHLANCKPGNDFRSIKPFKKLHVSSLFCELCCSVGGCNKPIKTLTPNLLKVNWGFIQEMMKMNTTWDSLKKQPFNNRGNAFKKRFFSDSLILTFHCSKTVKSYKRNNSVACIKHLAKFSGFARFSVISASR